MVSLGPLWLQLVPCQPAKASPWRRQSTSGHPALATFRFDGIGIVGSSPYHPWAERLGGTGETALKMGLMYGTLAPRALTVAIIGTAIFTIPYSARWYTHSALSA
jgi:hypothetical protein